MSASIGSCRRFLGTALNVLSSLWLAAGIMTILAVAMGWATFLEREMGTPVAQYIVYASNWFYFLIAALAVNVLCSAIVRVPKLFPKQAVSDSEQTKRRFESRLVPFFLAHLGVLLLIVGCLVTATRSSRARATISEGAAVETAVDADSRLFRIELTDLAAKDDAPKAVEIPFSGGPLNWRDYRNSKNWAKDVAEPILAQKPEGKFFQDVAKKASKLSQKTAYYFAKLARSSKPGVIYDRDGLKLEILDYATIADFAPVQPLKADFSARQADGSYKRQTAELPFSLDMTNASIDPLATSRRGQRVTLPNGTRVVYMLADSQLDMAAFKSALPENVEKSAERREDPNGFERGNDYVVLVVDGARYQKNLVDLALLSRYGSLDSQVETLNYQREEIARRLKLEEERDDVSEEERDSAKPLATTTRDDLVAQSAELRGLSEKMTALADEATEPGANPDAVKAFADARSAFERKRIENYLATTWSQLENVTPTSKEFKETLLKMQAQNDLRLEDVKMLLEATKLGDSGWKITAFESSPTLVPGVNELQGWSAMVRLDSPDGQSCEVSLFSELYERNRFPENGRVFGALWTEEASGDDNEYGRPWNKALGKPKLELMQDLAGRVAYRYNDGANNVVSGDLELETIDEDLGTVKAKRVELPKTDVEGSLESFEIAELTLQDEIGAKLMPTSFVKDQANEFYGKARVRVTLDDAVETFLLRTIPLESVSKEQIPYLERRIVSSKRQALVRLTDREIKLGAALYVKKFTATYEPGSSTAASFSSLTRILPEGLTREEQRLAALENPEQDVLIQMNRPGVLRNEASGKVYWAYQDSFRGPFKPGDEEFDSIVEAKLIPGETRPREVLYQTVVTLNDDPGRGLKYLGCLFVVWGTAALVYRRKKNAAAKQVDDNNIGDVELNPTANVAAGAKSGKASLLVLAILAALSAAFGFTKLATADEVVPPEEILAAKRANVMDWSPWRLLPVYDGGRRQPLNTFAQILVREISGSNAPTIYLPEDVLERLESGKPLNFPSLEDFLKDVAESDVPTLDENDKPSEKNAAQDAAKRAERESWYKEASSQAVARQEETARRLRAEFPKGSRKFEAYELLFSWIVEPELWEYLPFIADPKGQIAKNALMRTDKDCSARGYRLSPSDFDVLDANGKPRVDAYRAKARVDADSDALKALDKFEDRLASFRSVSLVPTQSPSSRPMFYMNKILYGDSPMGMGAFHQGSPSAISKLDAASDRIEKLLVHEKRALRKESPFNDKDFVLRRRTPMGSSGSETLMLARQISMLAQFTQKYSVAMTSALVEKLLRNLTESLDELKAHRDEIIAQEKFSVEYRQEIQRAVSALESIVDNLELSYLALTSEPPKALAIYPVVRESLFRATESQDSPWLPIQTFLWAADPAYLRFVDPNAQPVDPNADLEKLPTNAEKIDMFDDFAVSLRKTLDASVYERKPSRAFLDAAIAYRDVEAEDRGARFNKAMKEFTSSLAKLADSVEPKRVELAENSIEDEQARAEFLAKTQYRAQRGLEAELFYYRLDAFFWNWVACLAALVAFALSYARQFVYGLTRKGETLNERFFFTLGLVFLAASCAVAFLGGATRAYITGWAPVANMFETVVLLAFLIAAIAIGYALAPAWTKPFAAAWRATAFPNFVKTPDEKKISYALSLPRVLLVGYGFYLAFKVWRSGQPDDVDVFAGLCATARDAFAMKGALDSFAVLVVFLFVVWSVPRFLVSLAALAIFPKTTFRRPDLDAVLVDEQGVKRSVLSVVGAEIVQRKAFITASSVIALAVAASAYFNSVEFNPHIRPLVAVLRSNFWLTIHVIAIIVSYAVASIAWVVAITSLASYIFGKYSGKTNAAASEIQTPTQTRLSRQERRKAQREKTQASEVKAEPEPAQTYAGPIDPPYALKVAPVVATMIRSAVLFLTAGILLGARWADFSWGRFWSWDPKEVWALVTLLVYLVVLHVNKISGGKKFILALGANFGALAIVMTWYGLSFVMGGGGRHAYAAGESNKIVVLYALFAVNIVWALLAIARYCVEKSRRRKS